MRQGERFLETHLTIPHARKAAGRIRYDAKEQCGLIADLSLAGGPGSVAGVQAMFQFDHELFIRKISPGGSADLLAATLFLDALERDQYAVEEDNSLSEEDSYGTN